MLCKGARRRRVWGGVGISAGIAGENPPRPGVAEDSVPKPRRFRLLAFNMPLRGSLWRPCGDANSPMNRPGLRPGFMAREHNPTQKATST